MKRRDFLKCVTGAAAGAMVPAPAIWIRRVMVTEGCDRAHCR